MPNKLLLLAPPLLALAGQAVADDLQWNGFLNVVGGILQHDPVADVSDNRQYPGFLDYTGDLTFDQQTSAGLQVIRPLDDKSSVTAQLFAEGNDGTYNASFKWLYLTYNYSEFSRFRIGRIATPVFLFSDSINVGYSYHWVSPPREIYGFDSVINGIDYIYHDVAGEVDWSFEIYGGAADQYIPVIDAQIISRDTLASIFSASAWGWLSLRAMYFQTQTTFIPDALQNDDYIELAYSRAVESGRLSQAQMDALKPLIDPLIRENLAGPTALDDFKVRYGELAVRADVDNWFAIAEATMTRSDEYLYSNNNGGYLTAGVRFDRFQYHLTQSRIRTQLHDDVKADLHYQLPETPTQNDIADSFSKAILTAVAGTIARDIETTTLGVRYEATQSVALKMDVSYFEEAPSFASETAGMGHNLLFRSAINVIF